MQDVLPRFKQIVVRPIAVAVLLACGFLALFFTLCTATFETNDDVVMALIASGRVIALEPDSHLVFSHIFLGRLLAACYRWSSETPWYGLYLVSVHFAAIVSVCWAVLRGGINLVRLGLLVIFLSIVELYQLRYLQFTNTASLSAQAAMTLALSWCLYRPASRRQSACMLALAYLLACVAAIIRAETVWLMLPLFLPASAAAWWSVPDCRRGLAALLLASAASMLMLAAVDRAAYESDPQWRGFRRFNALRNRITDLGPDLGQTPAEIYRRRQQNAAAAGWTEADFRMLHAWGFFDAEKFNVASFERYLEGVPQFRTPVMIFRQLSIHLLQLRMIPVVFMLACVLPHVEWSRRNTLIVVQTFVMAAVVLLLLATCFKLARRVVLPSFAFSTLVAMLLVRPDRFGEWRLRSWTMKPKLSCSLVSLGLTALWGFECRMSQASVAANREWRNDLAQSGVGLNRLLISCGGALPIESILPLEDNRYLSSLRCCLFGWTNRTPLANRLLAEFGIQDLLGQLSTRRDLIVVMPPQEASSPLFNLQKAILYSTLPDYLAETEAYRPKYEPFFNGARFRLAAVQGIELAAEEKLEKR